MRAAARAALPRGRVARRPRRAPAAVGAGSPAAAPDRLRRLHGHRREAAGEPVLPEVAVPPARGVPARRAGAVGRRRRRGGRREDQHPQEAGLRRRLLREPHPLVRGRDTRRGRGRGGGRAQARRQRRPPGRPPPEGSQGERRGGPACGLLRPRDGAPAGEAVCCPVRLRRALHLRGHPEALRGEPPDPRQGARGAVAPGEVVDRGERCQPRGQCHHPDDGHRGARGRRAARQGRRRVARGGRPRLRPRAPDQHDVHAARAEPERVADLAARQHALRAAAAVRDRRRQRRREGVHRAAHREHAEAVHPAHRQRRACHHAADLDPALVEAAGRALRHVLRANRLRAPRPGEGDEPAPQRPVRHLRAAQADLRLPRPLRGLGSRHRVRDILAQRRPGAVAAALAAAVPGAPQDPEGLRAAEQHRGVRLGAGAPLQPGAPARPGRAVPAAGARPVAVPLGPHAPRPRRPRQRGVAEDLRAGVHLPAAPASGTRHGAVLALGTGALRGVEGVPRAGALPPAPGAAHRRGRPAGGGGRRAAGERRAAHMPRRPHAHARLAPVVAGRVLGPLPPPAAYTRERGRGLGPAARRPRGVPEEPHAGHLRGPHVQRARLAEPGGGAARGGLGRGLARAAGPAARGGADPRP
mmetsp:Transcript_26050/g.73615  ORF Transcript_26050/g.73615 Transcript_26050/m.73615 type:complete len:641 (-) Transcript_26050:213-2135(-)